MSSWQMVLKLEIQASRKKDEALSLERLEQEDDKQSQVDQATDLEEEEVWDLDLDEVSSDLVDPE